MNKTIKTNNNSIIKLDSYEISPFDPQYPITLLTSNIQNCLIEADNAAKDIYKAVTKNSPAIAQLTESKKSIKYVVDISDKMANDINSGKIKLTTNKAGETFAQIVGKDGKYGSKLPIKKEDLSVALDPIQMTMAMQMRAMQEQLEEIAEQINLIDKNVKEVKQGQQNDRIGQYYSGLSLFIESRGIEDQEMRKALVAQSLKTLSDAIFQLRLNFEADIQYLVNKEYNDAKGKRIELMDARINSINQGFVYIHQAEMAKAGIYCSEKELGAMATVLDEYSQFIDTKIAKNAKLLAQIDSSDKDINNGLWNKRASFKIDTSEFKKQLMTKEKTLYLEMEGK